MNLEIRFSCADQKLTKKTSHYRMNDLTETDGSFKIMNSMVVFSRILVWSADILASIQ